MFKALATILALTTILFINGQAMAQAPEYVVTCNYDFDGDGLDTIAVSDGASIPLNVYLNCDVYTTDPNVTSMDIDFIDPLGQNIGCDTCPGYPAHNGFSFDQGSLHAGIYNINAIFKGPTGDINQVIFQLNISFNVVPESPMGMVALVASSLVALGAFTFFKSKGKIPRRANRGQ